MAQHNELGKWGEEMAIRYLQNKGYIVIERDYKVGRMDLDIIATDEDGTETIFVEVKTRTWDDVMDPVYAVDRKKIRNIGKCANAYIKSLNLNTEIRFDIITIVGDNETNMNIEHIEDAFNPCLL